MTSAAVSRVSVGLLWQETNSFNPLPTGEADFVRHEGPAILDAYEATETALGGIIRRLRHLGLLPVPTFAAKARPGGPIRDAVVEALIDRLVEAVAAAQADAVCLELHGAMTGAAIDDVEGLLLERLREAVGNGIPVAVALDLHGHVTDRMVENADFLTGYRTHPHSDMAETGERAVDSLLAIARGAVKPVCARRSVPLLALWRDETSDPPMREVLLALAEEAGRQPRYLDASVFNTHPFLDLPGMGQVAIGYADGDAEAAARLADAAAAELWRQRAAFAGEAPTLAVVFEAARAARGLRPLAIGDQGDSVLAGAPGDSVEIARYGAAHAPELRGLIPVFDPAAVEAALRAGPGNRASLRLGAGVSPGLEPMEVTGTVAAITDGIFPNEGGYMKGVLNDLGATAIVQAGAQTFVVTSKAPAACDPGLVGHAGAALRDFDYIVVKSSNHFRLSLAATSDCWVAATPGLSSRKPDYLRHRRARPIYPIDKHSLI